MCTADSSVSVGSGPTAIIRRAGRAGKGDTGGCRGNLTPPSGTGKKRACCPEDWAAAKRSGSMGKGEATREANWSDARPSRASVGRLSLYLRHLEGLLREGAATVSSGQLGEA